MLKWAHAVGKDVGIAISEQWCPFVWEHDAGKFNRARASSFARNIIINVERPSSRAMLVQNAAATAVLFFAVTSVTSRYSCDRNRIVRYYAIDGDDYGHGILSVRPTNGRTIAKVSYTRGMNTTGWVIETNCLYVDIMYYIGRYVPV